MPAKGQKMDEAYKEMKRQELLERWQRPGYREMMSVKLMGHPVSEEARRKIGNRSRGQVATEDLKAKCRAATTRLWQDDAYAARHRARMQSPEVRAKLNLPEARKKIAAKKTEYWAAMEPAERLERCKNWLHAGTQANRGRTPSAETREKLSQHMKAWILTVRGMAHMKKLRDACLTCTRNTRIEQAVAAVLQCLAIPHEPSKMIGPYEADFFLPGFNGVIECDGTYWHSLPVNQARDRRKDSYLRNHGFVVVRLAESDITRDVIGCVQQAIDTFSTANS